MTLPEFVVKKKVTVVMVTLGIVGLGLISFFRLPQELFPPITFPQVTIVTDYANAAPEEVETLITKPIEEAVGSVAGLKRIESVSREGRSTVKVSFNWGQDIDFAALAVREKIDLIKERLPKESEDPVVLKFDPLAKPVLILSINGPNLTPVQLKLFAEKLFKDNLEKIEGVASAVISGGVNREILVSVDSARLEANHLSLLNVIDSIEKANVSYPAGSIKKGLYEYLIRTVGEFRSPKEIAYVVAGVDTVKKFNEQDVSFLEKGDKGPRDTVDTLRQEVQKQLMQKRLVLIRDIADVADGMSEKTSVSRYNGNDNISISIQKQANANTIQVVDRVLAGLETLREDIAARGLRYDVIYDHSIFIRRSLNDLANDATSGGFLAFLVLLFSLKALGPAFFVTLSIPITVLGTFFLMSLSGITLNTMSLGGLALGAGMIVDTSIVVLENIFRRRQLGEDPQTAAIKGSSEVFWPVVTSNATTIAVFFPLIVFVPGFTGQIFKDLSWAIINSQIISTIIPLTFIPMMSLYLNVKPGGYKPYHWTGFLEKGLLGATTIAQRIRFSAMVLIVAIGICSTAFLILPNLEREILPKVDQGQFMVKVDMLLGTRLEVTDRVCRRLEEAISSLPEVKDVAITIGSEKTEKGQVKVDSLRPSQGLILVNLKKDRKRSSAEVVHALQEKIKDVNMEAGSYDFVLQESEFSFVEGGGKPILIEVKGYDFNEIEKWVKKVKDDLRNIKGVFNIKDDMGERSPETKLNIDKRRAALYGISALDISLTAKAAIDGVVATQYREAGREYDVLVRLKEKDRQNLQTLGDLLLYSHTLDEVIPLKDVAAVDTKSSSPSEIKRMDQERTVTISAEIEKSVKSQNALAQVQTLLRNLAVSPETGVQIKLSGKAKEFKENFTKVTFAFVLAVVLVYMIMAAQFESFVQPLVIMITVPLATFGVAMGLLLSGNTVNVISALGVIILLGPSVGNGIVLIEYINQLRDEGMDVEEAAIEASKVRTRPIVMSAMTSVMGLVPLALGLGEGAELRAPMAVTMMGGLLSSTALTLIVLPCFYILVIRSLERFFGDPEEEEDEPPAALPKQSESDPVNP